MVDVNPSGVMWRKSSRSNTGGGGCVEIGAGASCMLVRDSKDADGAIVTLSTAGWRSFVFSVHTGRLD